MCEPDWNCGGACITVEEARALARMARRVARDGCFFVEVGSWTGYSTAVLARVAQAHQGRVLAVDHWRGSPQTHLRAVAEEQDVLALFRENLRREGVADVVRVLVMPSLEAAAVLRDGIADLIFLDGDHRYEAVRADLAAWEPKLRPGGLLCGHDYEAPERALPFPLGEHLQAEYVACQGIAVHPGVIRAVDERYGEQVSQERRIWKVAR